LNFYHTQCLVRYLGQNKRIAPIPFMDVVKEGLIALTPEIDYDQMAMGLPPVTFVVYLIAK
jgi:hypothetical protein